MKPVLLAALATASLMSAQQMPVEGNASSAIRVIIYEDLQCPDCADFRKLLDEKLLPKYGAKIAFEHRDFPLPKHAHARKEAVISRWLASKSAALYIDWRRYMLAHIDDVKADFPAVLTTWAKAHSLDPADLTAAIDDRKLDAAVEADFQDGIARGVAKTPTVFVEGEAFVETIPLEVISAALDRALQ